MSIDRGSEGLLSYSEVDDRHPAVPGSKMKHDSEWMKQAAVGVILRPEQVTPLSDIECMIEAHASVQ